MTSLTKGTRRRRSRNGIVALLASTALAGLPAGVAQAQDATWSSNPVSLDFDNAANWVGGAVPTGTATFGASTNGIGITTLAPRTMAGWAFTAGHTGYHFTGSSALTFTGAGISNAGIVVTLNAFGGLTFRNASKMSGIHVNGFSTFEFLDSSQAGGSIHNFAALNFRDSSSAGAADIDNFAAIGFWGSSSAGTATIFNLSSGFSTTFNDNSTAGSAVIDNSYGGSTTFSGNSTAASALIRNYAGGSTTFDGSSTAGTATIFNFDRGVTSFKGNSSASGAQIENQQNAGLGFFDSSSAGTARITNSGIAEFTGTSTAASSTITNIASLTFLNNATAGAATISNTRTDPSLIASLTFSDSSTAGTASITNGRSSNLFFYGGSTAGSAAITNHGLMSFEQSATAGSAAIGNSSFVQFIGGSSAGSAAIINYNTLQFGGTSTAGTANITSSWSLSFHDTATAASATITNTGATYFNSSSTAGSATITNTGTTQFNGSSTADSATITNTGWIEFSGSSTAGSAIITSSSDTGFGILSFWGSSTAGSSTISHSGDGAMSFFGSSTAGSATIVNSGWMTFNQSSSAGAASISNGGNLQFVDASSTGNATITTSGQLGLATTDLTGAATVTVRSGGMMLGYGSAGNTTVEAGGMIVASGGTLRINGNLTLAAGSTYGYCACSQTAVTGTATLGGATLVVPQATFQAQSHTFLTATGGVSGTFAFDAGTTPFASLLYGTNDVTVSIAAYTVGGALGAVGGTNARNVGGALDRVIVASAGAPPSSLYPLLGLYGAPLAQALNGLSGEAATGAQVSAFTGASTFLGIMLDPMAGARGATAAAPGSSLIEMADTGRTPAGRVAAGWSVWTKAFGQAGRTASDAPTGAVGTASSLYGVAAGADRLISPDTLIGFALAGGGTSYGLGTRGTGTGDFAQLGFYGSTRLGPGYVSAALAYGWNRFDVSRTAGLGPLETYRSAPTVHTFGGRIEAGRRFGGAALAATPYAAIEAIGASTAGYRESWAAPDTGAFALAYAARTYATARAEAGVRLDSLRAVAQTADLLTFARLAYGFQAGTQRSAEASFQQLANSGFTVFGARASTHTALASLGAELRLVAGTRLAGSLDAELGDRHRSLRANLSLRQSW